MRANLPASSHRRNGSTPVVVATSEEVIGGVDAAVGEGCWRWGRAGAEECTQHIHRIGDGDVPGIIGIEGIKAGDGEAIEEVIEDANAIGDGDGTILVGISPDKQYSIAFIRDRHIQTAATALLQITAVILVHQSKGDLQHGTVGGSIDEELDRCHDASITGKGWGEDGDRRRDGGGATREVDGHRQEQFVGIETGQVGHLEGDAHASIGVALGRDGAEFQAGLGLGKGGWAQ